MKTFKKKPTVLIGDNHEVVINKKSKKLIIFFTGTGTGAKPGHFFFYTVGKKLDANVLFINNGFNEWYQEGIPSLGTTNVKDTVEIINKWKSYLNVKDIYLCGASMGAYGAMLYGTFFDNARILAFGPEIDLLEEGSRSISYIKENQNINYNLKSLLEHTTNKVHIYVGEDDPIDIYQANKCASFYTFSNIEIHSVLDVNHSVVAYLKSKNKLLEFMEAFLDDRELPKVDIEGSGCRIENFAKNYYLQYNAFKKKDWIKSVKYGEKAISEYVTASFSQYMLGVGYTQIEDFNKGLSHLSIARSLSPLKLDYQFAVANCMRRMGQLDKARYLHQKILQVNKDFSKSHYDLSLIYGKMKDKKGAIARAKHAFRVEPKNISYQKRVEKLIGKKGSKT